MKKLTTFPTFFNLIFFNSIEKTLVALSKPFKDKRQRRNFLVFNLSLIFQGKPFLSLAYQITSFSKNWKACLSHFLKSKVLSLEFLEGIRQRFLKRFFKDLKFVVLDFTALVKIGKHFQYLSSVYDARDGKIKDGYSLLLSLGITDNLLKIPLIWKLISYHCQFKSQNLEVVKLLLKLKEILKNQLKKVVFLADRGFDHQLFIEWFLKNKYYFFIRANNNKKVKLEDGRICLLSNLSEGIYKKAEILKWKISLKIVLKEKKKERFIFLVHPDLSIESLKQAQELYFQRWQIDLFFEESKQRYGLEKFRIRSFEAIEKVLSLTFLCYQIVETISFRYQSLIVATSNLVFKTNQYFQRSIYFLRNLAQKISFFGLTEQILLRLTEIRTNSP